MAPPAPAAHRNCRRHSRQPVGATGGRDPCGLCGPYRTRRKGAVCARGRDIRRGYARRDRQRDGRAARRRPGSAETRGLIQGCARRSRRRWNSAIMVFPGADRFREPREKMAKLLPIVLIAALGCAPFAARAAPGPVIVMPLTGAIGPASEDFVERGLARADKEGAELVVLEIDTPGGLDTSMREIIKFRSEE